MIIDPTDPQIAIDHHGHVYRPDVWEKDEDGNPKPVWVRQMDFDPHRDFRRPEW